jgi:hypothetical protein
MTRASFSRCETFIFAFTNPLELCYVYDKCYVYVMCYVIITTVLPASSNIDAYI